VGGAPAVSPTLGVTASSITVGNVSTLSGPVPGLFQGTVNGVKAYFDYINSQGGVNGRKLVQKVGDDALSCTQNKSMVASLASSVFAFVGSESVVDSCGVPSLPVSTPLISAEALTPQTQNLATGFSPLPLPPGFITGPYLYLAQKYAADVKSVGILYSTSASFPTHAQEYAMSQSGWKVTYQRGFAATETQFTSDVLRMKSQGVKLLWLVNTTADDADIVQQAYQQNWHPLIVLYNGYDHQFEKDAGNAASNGVLNFNQQSMFLGEDAASVPAVATFTKWMSTANPGYTPDLFSVYGWEAAALFVAGLQNAGANPTQASLLAALRNIHSFDADGLSAPYDPGNNQPSTCWLETTVVNGTWKRVNPPTSGFTCSPGGYAHYSGS